MADEVWALAAGESLEMSTFNGIGTELKGFTRPDATGRYFGTRYVTLFGLPIVPLGRYYLRQTTSEYRGPGTVTRYAIAGRSRPRAAEILRTYLYCWLFAPAIVLAPILTLLYNADHLAEKFAFGWLLGAFFLCLLVSIAILTTLHATYRTRWAPTRQAQWLDRPPSQH
jgi:hypothetical protein